MSTTILSVIGGLLVLLLGYQLKKLDDLTVSFHRDFLALTKAVGALSTKVEVLDSKVEHLSARFDEHLGSAHGR